MTEKFIVLDPTLEVEATRVERASRPKHIRTLGMLDNGKHNSNVLLNQIATLLSTHYPGVTLRYYRKPSPYRPAPPSLLDQVASENDAVLVGIGD